MGDIASFDCALPLPLAGVVPSLACMPVLIGVETTLTNGGLLATEGVTMFTFGDLSLPSPDC